MTVSGNILMGYLFQIKQLHVKILLLKIIDSKKNLFFSCYPY
jgi:hypothetical protein